MLSVGCVYVLLAREGGLVSAGADEGPAEYNCSTTAGAGITLPSNAQQASAASCTTTTGSPVGMWQRHALV